MSRPPIDSEPRVPSPMWRRIAVPRPASSVHRAVQDFWRWLVGLETWHWAFDLTAPAGQVQEVLDGLPRRWRPPGGLDRAFSGRTSRGRYIRLLAFGRGGALSAIDRCYLTVRARAEGSTVAVEQR